MGDLGEEILGEELSDILTRPEDARLAASALTTFIDVAPEDVLAGMAPEQARMFANRLRPTQQWLNELLAISEGRSQVTEGLRLVHQVGE